MEDNRGNVFPTLSVKLPKPHLHVGILPEVGMSTHVSRRAGCQCAWSPPELVSHFVATYRTALLFSLVRSYTPLRSSFLFPFHSSLGV
jgi:hypothetical protein